MAEAAKHSKAKALFIFYGRRALRIFPLYYIIVFLFLFLGYEIVKSNSGYFLLYGVNFLIMNKQEWLNMVTHLWSLSVEEQFYLLWPFFILFFSRKYLVYAVSGLIILSLVYVSGSYVWGTDYSFVNLFFCVSTLGAGGILAFFKNRLIVTTTKKTVWLLALLMVVFYAVSLKHPNVIWFHLAAVFYSTAFLIILLRVKNKALDFFFKNRVLSWLGKISYGLYLFHNITPWLLRNLKGTETEFKVLNFSILPATENGYITLVSQFALLFLIASLSWYIIEKPINSLKDKLNY